MAKTIAGPASAGPVSRSALAGALKAVSKSIKKNLGDAILLYDATLPTFSIPYWVSTGAPDLDYVLGGGIPGGRIVEIYSKSESEGKSSIAITIARECQRAGGVAAYFDAEHTVLPEYFQGFGLDLDTLIFLEPGTLEGFFEVVEASAKEFRDQFPAPAPIVFILDSVAAAATMSQEEADYDKQGVAAKARVMSSSLSKLAPVLARNGVTLVLINQSRTNIGVMYGDPDSTPGGRAMKFYATQRIALRRSAKLTSDGTKNGDLVGIMVEAHVVKNKVARPFQKSSFKLIFGRGVSYAESAFDLMVRKGSISGGAAGRYTHVASGASVTRNSWPEFLASHPELKAEVSALVLAQEVYVPPTEAEAASAAEVPGTGEEDDAEVI